MHLKGALPSKIMVLDITTILPFNVLDKRESKTKHQQYLWSTRNISLDHISLKHEGN